MPQEFDIVRCFSCEIFQVHFVKKETTWTCKICSEKQSLKQVFFRGVARHCRKHVQDLNMKRGKLYEETVDQTEEEEEEPDYGDFPPPVAPIRGRDEKKPGPDVNSKWFKYI